MANIIILGAAGRMGKNLIHATDANPEAKLGGAIDMASHPAIGSDASLNAGLQASGVMITASLDEALPTADVVIDFTAKEALSANLQAAVAAQKAIVIGTTGWGDEELAEVTKAAETIPVVLARNFSTGITLLTELVAQTSKILGSPFDIEIIESHHKHKKDSPSGTALHLAEAAASAREQNFYDSANYGRQGMVGERPDGEIAVHAVRGGDVVGEHSVLFLADGERIELTHKASSRMTFAHGAVRAAVWLLQQKPGVYDMKDVLGL